MCRAVAWGIHLILSKCLRCGKCCIIFNKYEQEWQKCRFLELINPLRHKFKTRCKIYKTRIGTPLGWGFFCKSRAHLPYNIPQCPYNKKGLPIHPNYRSMKQ